MKNVMVMVVLTPDEAMMELDKNMKKTCDIADMLVRNYGIKITGDEFDKVFDIVNA